MDDPESRAQSDPPEGSELDAEGEEVDEEFEQSLANGFIAHQDNTTSDNENAEDGLLDEVKDADDASSQNDESSSASSVSEENEWQGSSHSEEDAESKTVDTNRCVFCGQDEEHDPSEEFEEYLECVICGSNAHRQCARDEDALDSDEEASAWRCKACVDSGALPDSTVELPEPRKTARDLLPDLRGTKQTDSHTEFESALEDDPLDGSRSLRKRKASEEDANHRLRKRRRPSDSITASAGPDRSPSPSANGDGDQSGRPLRLRRRKSEKPLVHTVSAHGASLIISFNLDRERVQKILDSKQKKNRGAIKPKKKAPPLIIEDEPPHYPPLPSSQLFYFERDETKKHYGGILSDGEAENSKTIPGVADRERFEASRQKAEDDWKKKMTDTDNIPEPTKPSQKMSGPPSKIKCINFGGYEIDTWNTAPYPEEYSRNKIIYICEFCLKYMNSDFVAWRHKLKCEAQFPPGDEIYRDGKHSFFEVDGRKHPVYCQNLCLLAKLFLGSKTLYYDVEPFLFYIMTENDEFGCHFVGYFSKEKRSSSQNNVSCILVMPIYQRRGFGHMLIEFSYLLTKAEQKTGSPEKPLSDMGLVSYRGYWRLMMCYQLVNEKGSVSISELSKRTGMTADDVVSALEGLRALVRDPITKTYALRLDYEYFKEYIDKYEKKNYPRINPDALVWVPFVAHHGLNMQFEGGQVHAVAPREDGSEADAEGGAEAQQSADGGKITEEGGSEMETDVPMTNGEGTDGRAKVNGVNGVVNGVANGDAANGGATTPSTPVPNGDATIAQLLNTVWGTPHPGLGIPPTRFEVFPPVPGLTVKRKPGRPFGSTKKRPGTPRSNGSTKVVAPGAHTGSPMARRSRATDAAPTSNGGGGEAAEDGPAPAGGHKVKDEAEMQLQAQQAEERADEQMDGAEGSQAAEVQDAGEDEDTDADAEGEDE